jgi:hypothetical protein
VADARDMVMFAALFACTASDAQGDPDCWGDGGCVSSETGVDSTDSTGTDIDADADGYPSAEDCNDADATVHPGAADACDGVDRNCDGHVVDEGGCGEVTEVEDTFPVAFYRDYLYAGIDCVWSPSGGDVLVDLTALGDWSWGGYAVYRWTGSTFDYALSLAGGSLEVYEHCSVVGDFDGDGLDDLAIHGGSREGEYIGELALISGDEARWPTELTAIDDAAYAVWEGVQGGDQFSEELAAGDIDGDGLVDIVTHAPADVGEENGGKSGWLFVIRGRSEGFPTADDTEAVRDEWYYLHSRDPISGTPVDEHFTVEVVHPDLDGDGLGDLLGTGSAGSYVVIPGANLVSMQGAYIEDLVDTQSEEVTDRYSRFEPGACDDLDFDGDGVADCMFRSSSDQGAMFGIVSGADLAAGLEPIDVALTTAGPIGASHPIRDLDGDGVRDIGFVWAVDSGTQCVIASSRLPLGGTLATEDIAPCWRHADDMGYLIDLAVGDFDGSGVPDLVLSQRPYESGASVPMYLLRDLALPWDDPARW